MVSWLLNANEISFKLQNSDRYPEKLNFKEILQFLVLGYIGIGNIPIPGSVIKKNLEFPTFSCMYPEGNIFLKCREKAGVSMHVSHKEYIHEMLQVSCTSMYVSCREYNHEMLYETWNFLHNHACILQGIVYKYLPKCHISS